MLVTSTERARIVAALQTGKSQYAVAKAFGRSPGTVNAIGQQAGVSPGHSATKQANAARRDYAQAERLLFINEIFDKARELLQTVKSADDLQRIAITAGILVDKRRLEDGEATSRSENLNADLTRDRLASRVDELATRRGQKAAAG
jgi:hypothetical protein